MGGKLCVYDKNGTKVTNLNQPLSCMSYSISIGKKYNANINFLCDINKELNKIFTSTKAALWEKISVLICFNEKNKFTKEDIPILRECINNYPIGLNNEPKEMFQKILNLVIKYGEIYTIVNGKFHQKISEYANVNMFKCLSVVGC